MELLTRLLLAVAPVVPLSMDGRLLDASVLLFALGISLLALLCFGVVSALRIVRFDLMNGLRGGSKLVMSGGGTCLRATLVIAEVALLVVLLVLLVTAGLLLRSFLLLQQVDLGFATDRVVFAYMQYAVDESSFERQMRRIGRIMNPMSAGERGAMGCGAGWCGRGIGALDGKSPM